MWNTAPHPTPRHRSVRHPPVLAMAPGRVPWAYEGRRLGDRGVRGHQRTRGRLVRHVRHGGRRVRRPRPWPPAACLDHVTGPRR